VPDNVQLTPAFAESFATVAVKLAVPPTVIFAVVCDRLTTIVGAAAVTVIAAVALFVVSETDVAVSVTAGGAGTLAGAV